MRAHRRLSPPFLAALGAALLVAVLFFSFALSSGLLREHDTGIVLPDGAGSQPVVSTGSQLLTAQAVADVEIHLGNAKKVIASLMRPEAYSCRIDNTLYYSGGSSVLSCRRYANGSAVRTDTLSAAGGVQSTLLRAGDTVYAWNAGELSAYGGNWGDFSDDAAAMLPTYEDVLDSDVTLEEAARQDVDFEPCIRVAFDQDGYRCIYYISAATGLLKTASFYSGSTLARQVTVSELKTEQPEDAVFVLPDGQSVLGG